MTTICRLITVWMLTFAGILLLPVMSIATVTSTTHDLLATTTTAPTTIAEHTTLVETNSCPEITLRSMARDPSRSLFVQSHFLNAPKMQTLFHYTDELGLEGITQSQRLNPSLKALNPNDVRYGNGQYLSDFVPGTKTPAQLSREFLGQPFQGQRYSNFIEIDVSGLNVIQGRNGVFVIPNETPLDLSGRIISSGAVQ